MSFNPRPVRVYRVDESYGRGVGRSCLHDLFECDCNTETEDKIGLMCYPKCREHFESFGCCICNRKSCDTGDRLIDGFCLPN